MSTKNIQMKPVGETGKDARRRRSNRPGNSQANGPLVDGSLESSDAARMLQALTDGVR